MKSATEQPIKKGLGLWSQAFFYYELALLTEEGCHVASPACAIRHRDILRKTQHT